DLLLVAQPSRTVVCQDRAGRDRTRRVHLGTRSEEKAHAIHPSVQPAGQTREVEILRSLTTDYSCFNRYSPLVPPRGRARYVCPHFRLRGSPSMTLNVPADAAQLGPQ